jgi:alanine dehydrogenase
MPCSALRPAPTSARPILGLKAGGYWPGNLSRGLTNHQSSTLLFDPDTGRASALVSANYLTGVRTGRGSAIATKHLARPDAETLGIIGTGGQSTYQLQATLAVRQTIRRVHAWNRSKEKLLAFGRVVEDLGLTFFPETEPETVARAADVLVTVTPSKEPLVEAGWVRPGAHISAMGADTRGKQELDPRLVADSAVFVDEVAQAVTIGECQHAVAAGLISADAFRSVGDLVAGRCEGRRNDDEITLFDGTGVALQDLVVADLAVKIATAKGLGVRIDDEPQRQ